MKPLLLAAMLAGANGQGAAGDPTCPCINATALLDGLSTLSAMPAVDYGSLECQSWDATRLECTANAPDWCAAQWCYVDRDACRNATFLIHATKDYPTLDSLLYYSYGTCGVDQPVCHTRLEPQTSIPKLE